MTTAETFLRDFFAARGIAGPSGDPLYSYRVTGTEFEQLRDVVAWELRRNFSSRRLGPKGAMAFCLWASEWWRRNYEAGPWKWQPMLAALGAQEFAPPPRGSRRPDRGRSRYQELQDLVVRGIKFWDRTVYRMGPSREFLVTLVLEGGLPTNLILREETHLRSYLEAVLEEFKLFGATGTPARDLAERARHHLPRAWQRKAVYELCGELAQKLWALQAELGPTATPVLDLDRKRRDWRDDLPLRVTDDVARTLLNGLLEGAVEVARRVRVDIRWNVDLAPVADGDWELRGWFKLPRRVSAEGFTRLFRPEGPASAFQRYDLGARTEKKAFRALAMATEARDEKGWHYRLRPVQSVRSFQTADLTGARKLLARSHSGVLSTDEFPGASGLGDLPWVFAPVESQGGDRATCRLAGQGTVRVSHAWALVAVRNGVRVESRDGEVTAAGRVRGRDHVVYRVRGTAAFVDSDEVTTIVQTSADEDGASIEYHLEGDARSFGGAAASFFLGGPRVQKRSNGEFHAWIPERNLEWKPNLPGASWGRYTRAAVDYGVILGEGRLRCMEGEVVRHSVSIAVLPEGADVRLLPSSDERRGEIRLIGFGEIEASVTLDAASDLRVAARKEGSDYRLALHAADEAPRHVTVAVDWHGRGRAMLELPFPARRATFVGTRDRPLPTGARLARGSLAGVEAEVLVPTSGRYQLRAYSGSGDAPGGGFDREAFVREIPEVGYGHHVLDLAQVDSEITEQLESSDRPRREIRLRIVDAASGEAFPAKVSVSTFDVAFARRGDGLLVLDGRVTEEDLAELSVEMLPLLEPDRELVSVPRTDVGWQVPSAGLEPGPYLVLGRQGDLQRVRPMPWYAVDPDGSDDGTGDGTAAATVADAYALAFRRGQRFSHEPFSEVVREMAVDPGHDDWRLVVEYARLESLPVAAFPLLRALVRHPEACAMALADASSEDFELLWERMERFPFAWWQIPLDSWKQTYKRYAEHWESVFNAVEDTELAWDMLERQTDSSIDRVKSRLVGLGGALDFLKDHVASRKIGNASKFADPARIRTLQHEHDDHRRTCPALNQSPQSLPDLSQVRSEARKLVDANPWAKSIFLPADTGAFAEPRRANFADAPALTAAMTIAGVHPPKDLARLIRHLRADHRSWFDEALRLAQLIAFGRREAHKIAVQQAR